MRGYIETLRMPEVALDADRRDRYFETTDRETRRLERIVKDLLDLPRYEGGGVVLQRRLFDIDFEDPRVCQFHRPSLEGAGTNAVPL
jgi:K+-sensing histidine kinase KdpD